MFSRCIELGVTISIVEKKEFLVKYLSTELQQHQINIRFMTGETVTEEQTQLKHPTLLNPNHNHHQPQLNTIQLTHHHLNKQNQTRWSVRIVRRRDMEYGIVLRIWNSQ
jgi:hypothetical protein